MNKIFPIQGFMLKYNFYVSLKDALTEQQFRLLVPKLPVSSFHQGPGDKIQNYC